MNGQLNEQSSQNGKKIECDSQHEELMFQLELNDAKQQETTKNSDNKHSSQSLQSSQSSQSYNKDEYNDKIKQLEEKIIIINAGEQKFQTPSKSQQSSQYDKRDNQENNIKRIEEQNASTDEDIQHVQITKEYEKDKKKEEESDEDDSKDEEFQSKKESNPTGSSFVKQDINEEAFEISSVELDDDDDDDDDKEDEKHKVNTPFSYVPDYKFYELKGKYPIEYLRQIETDKDKIDMFYNKVIPSLRYQMYFKYENKLKYVCMYEPCQSSKKSFSYKQSFLRHLMCRHQNELPGGGAFLMPRSTLFTCQFCRLSFTIHEQYLMHLKNCRAVAYLEGFDDDNDDDNNNDQNENGKISFKLNASSNQNVSNQSASNNKNSSIQKNSCIRNSKHGNTVSHSLACSSNTETCSKITISKLKSKINNIKQVNSASSNSIQHPLASVSKICGASNCCVLGKSNVNHHDNNSRTINKKMNFQSDQKISTNDSESKQFIFKHDSKQQNNSIKRELSSYSINGREDKKFKDDENSDSEDNLIKDDDE
jgi:hypothetical protein